MDDGHKLKWIDYFEYKQSEVHNAYRYKTCLQDDVCISLLC